MDEQNHDVDNLRYLAALRPIDDEFVRCLLRGDEPLVREILRIVTGLDDIELSHVETQRDVKIIGSRAVEMDGFATDTEGRTYNFEVERSLARAKAKRARYHSAALDVDALEAGDEFDKLPETYIIFLTEKDPYAKGAGVYRFDRWDNSHELALGDEAHILYANAEYDGDDELGALMHDFLCADPDEMLTPILAERVRHFKQTAEGADSMTAEIDIIRREIFAKDHERAVREGHAEGLEQGLAEGLEQGLAEGLEQGLAEGLEQGRAEGRAEGREEIYVSCIKTLMESLGVTAQEAMEKLGVSRDDQPSYLQLIEAEA